MRYLTLLIFLFPFSMAAQNVGIGTTNPQKKLDVKGSVKIADTLEIEKTLSVGNTEPLSTLHILHDASAGPTQGLRIDNSFDPGQDDNWWNIHTQGSSGDLFFYSGDSPTTASINFVLESDGDVGIGTHNPQERLEVVGNMKVSDGILVESLSGNKHRNVIVDQDGYLISETNPINNNIESQKLKTSNQNIFNPAITAQIFADFGPGINGEVTVVQFEDNVLILGIDHFLFKNTDKSTGIPSGSIRNRYFTFTKKTDRSTAPLISKYKNDDVFSQIVFTIHSNIGGSHTDPIVFTLTNAKIAEYSLEIQQSDLNQVELLECFLLSYDTINMEYKYYDNSGVLIDTNNTTVNWNF